MSLFFLYHATYILKRFYSLLFKHIFKNIIPPVELGKKDEEQNGVPPNPVGKNNWVVTFNKEELESVQHQTHKLYL